jgi:hypothetical protein
MHSASEACFGDIMPIESTVQDLGHRPSSGGWRCPLFLARSPTRGFALSKSLRGVSGGSQHAPGCFFCVWVLPVGP